MPLRSHLSQTSIDPTQLSQIISIPFQGCRQSKQEKKTEATTAQPAPLGASKNCSNLENISDWSEELGKSG